jgi:hypothetical protein
MLFYKVKPEYDNVRFVFKNNSSGFLVGNELFTPIEAALLPSKLIDKACDLVNIKKNNTHWFFGARFENKN